MFKNEPVVVVGAGIAGLTAAALLAHEGISEILLEAHSQAGGCAGTFRRKGYVFDVGATQVAGLEPGGIHDRLFRYLESPIPKATILDPACVVDLGDGLSPIRIWNKQSQWQSERSIQFPGSEAFWTLCERLHKSNWSINARDPVLPVRSFWDMSRLLQSIRLENIPSAFFTTLSISDLLRLCGCHKDQRLRKFLDFQLKLYSQKSANQTAALYGATVLQMSQAPHGLWHLEGSMQKMSDCLSSCLERDGAEIYFKHRVTSLTRNRQKSLWIIDAIDSIGASRQFQAKDVICSLPPQCLLDLIPSDPELPKGYRQQLEALDKSNGAIVLYGGIDRKALPERCPSHIQITSQEFESFFISISREGDGRAPIGQATLIASTFTDIDFWDSLNPVDYKSHKATIQFKIIQELNRYFGFSSQVWFHQELATPRSFYKWTGRPKGIVGGLGQHPLRFGPFSLPSRTPIRGLWLCGDSIYPGEGTAGVSQSSLVTCRQILASRGCPQINIEKP